MTDVKAQVGSTPGRFEFSECRLPTHHFQMMRSRFARFSGVELHGEAFNLQSNGNVYVFHRLWITYAHEPRRDVLDEMAGWIDGFRDALDAVKA